MLDRAEEFIFSVKNPSIPLWTALLTASHNYGDIARTERVAAQVNNLIFLNINININ